MNDYIKREEALEEIAFVNEQISREKDIERIVGAGAYLLNLGAKEAISSIAAADVRENVHAHWTNSRTFDHDGEWYCSSCFEGITIYMGAERDDRYRFCPYCGAVMDEEAQT